MTLQEFADKLSAYCLVLPHLKDQTIYNVSITQNADIRISLEEAMLTLPID